MISSGDLTTEVTKNRRYDVTDRRGLFLISKSPRIKLQLRRLVQEMHAKVRVGARVCSKFKGSTVFLKDFQIRILNFMKIRSVMAKFLNEYQWKKCH
jgi:hypothetical protein